MLGLQRHTVRVVEHDPAWAAAFDGEARAIRRAGGGLILDLQHVGSTAVPGLPAKPILDIAGAVRSAGDVPELVRRLTAAGYLDRGDDGGDGGHLLVRDAEPEVRTVHLHIVERSDPQWRRYLAFRDLLRRDAGVRGRYGELKRRLAASHPRDREGYTAGKHDFIREALGRDGAEERP